VSLRPPPVNSQQAWADYMLSLFVDEGRACKVDHSSYTMPELVMALAGSERAAAADAGRSSEAVDEAGTENTMDEATSEARKTDAATAELMAAPTCVEMLDAWTASYPKSQVGLPHCFGCGWFSRCPINLNQYRRLTNHEC
jgi:hypothetical protein